MSLEQVLAKLESDEFVDFSMNPHAPAIRVIVRKGSSTDFTKAQFSVSLSGIREEATGYDAWHGTLLSKELERTLETLRLDKARQT